MNYTHKLSSRLARLRRAALLVTLALGSACSSDGGDLMSPDDNALSELAAKRRHVVSFAVIPDTAYLHPLESTRFIAEAKFIDGTRRRIRARWLAERGTIDSTGRFTADSTQGTYRVIASTSTGLADTAIVVQTSQARTLLNLVLTPAAVSLGAGATQQFTATGLYDDNTSGPLAVTYAATGGAMSAEGLYTAGATAGGYKVIATNEASGKADTSVVTVTASEPPAPAPELPPAPEPGGCDTDKSKLTFYGSFEAPSPWDTWRLDEATPDPSETWGLNALASPTRECGQAARIELRESDGIIAGNHRREIKLQNTGASGGNGGVPVPSGVTPIGGLGSEVWWGWSVYIPSDWVFETRWAPETIMQVVQAGRSPAFSVGIDGANFYTETRYGYGSQGSSTISVVQTSTTPVTRGAWTDFVVHAKWSAGDDGLLEIWKDGRQIVSRHGPTAYRDWSSAPYPKWGIYKWSWTTTSNSIVSERALLIDAVRITDGAHGSYDVVAPR